MNAILLSTDKILIPVTAMSQGIIGDGMLEIDSSDSRFAVWLPFAESSEKTIVTLKGSASSGFHGHAGRPGKVGGSLLGKGIAISTSSKDDVLLGYLNQVSNISKRSTENLVLEYGKTYIPQELPDGYARGNSKECFANAYRLAESDDELTYIEGFAMPDFVDLPMQHAWVVDKEGNVIDNTWSKAGTSYVGIPFDINFVNKIMADTGVYGILGYASYHYFENGMPEDAMRRKMMIILKGNGWAKKVRNVHSKFSNKANITLKGTIIVLKGEGMGHPFRGNQWTRSGQSAAITSASVDMLKDTSRWHIAAHQYYNPGISKSFIVEIDGDGKAIVKKEAERYSEPTSPYKESDAYQISEELGLGVVPTSAMVIGPPNLAEGDELSAQSWIDNAETIGSFRDYYNAKDIDVESFEKVAWLDAIIGNTDRHGQNMLVKVDENGLLHAIAIDNGLSFYYASNTRFVYEPMDTFRNAKTLTYTASQGNSWVSKIDNYKFHRSYYDVAKTMLTTVNPLSTQLKDRYGQQFIDDALHRLDKFSDLIDMTGHGWNN